MTNFHQNGTTKAQNIRNKAGSLGQSDAMASVVSTRSGECPDDSATVLLHFRVFRVFRGENRSAYPKLRLSNALHPGGMPEDCEALETRSLLLAVMSTSIRVAPLPSLRDGVCREGTSSGGVAALNYRLISVTSPGSVQRAAPVDWLWTLPGWLGHRRFLHRESDPG